MNRYQPKILKTVLLLLCLPFISNADFYDITTGKKLIYGSEQKQNQINALNYYDEIQFEYPVFKRLADTGIQHRINKFFYRRVIPHVKTKSFKVSLFEHLERATFYFLEDEERETYNKYAGHAQKAEPDLEKVEYDVLNYTHPIAVLQIDYKYKAYIERDEIGEATYRTVFYVNVETGNIARPKSVFKDWEQVTQTFKKQLDKLQSIASYDFQKPSKLPGNTEKQKLQLKPSEGVFPLIIGNTLLLYIPPYYPGLYNHSRVVLHKPIGAIKPLLDPEGPYGKITFFQSSGRQFDFQPLHKKYQRSGKDFKSIPFLTFNLPPESMTKGVKKIIKKRRSKTRRGLPGYDTVRQYRFDTINRISRIFDERTLYQFYYKNNHRQKMVKKKYGKIENKRLYRYDQYGRISSIKTFSGSVSQSSSNFYKRHHQILTYTDSGVLIIHLYSNQNEVYDNVNYYFYGNKPYYTKKYKLGSVDYEHSREFNGEGELIAVTGKMRRIPRSSLFSESPDGQYTYKENQRYPLNDMVVRKKNSKGLTVQKTKYATFKKIDEQYTFDYTDDRISKITVFERDQPDRDIYVFDYIEY